MSPRPQRSARERAAGRFSPVTVGAFALALILVAAYFGFTKDLPFTGPFQLKATFESANSIRPNSPVRIAGVNVGKVKKVEALEGSSAAVVTMEIQKQGLPIHKDATLKIRPRIFLEGNFFIDLQPGTPSAPVLSDGESIRITQTSRPVQLDDVLTTLQRDTREDLQTTLDELGTALTAKPTAAQDADSDPVSRGKTGAQALNDAADDAPAALRSTAQVAEAFLGTEPSRDVQRLIRGLARTTGALARNEGALKGVVTNLNTTLGALAAEQGNLRASVRELPNTLAAAGPALDALNASFPPTRALARELIPGVRETPATIKAGFPFVAQARKLVSNAELGGLAKRLAPATRDLADFTNRQIALLPQIDLIDRCALDDILPTGDVVIRDEFTTGVENYKEFMYGMVGLAGEGANFDGNGSYVRFQTGGGTQSVSLGQAGSALGQLFGNAAAVPIGSRPAYPNKRPPYRNDVPCYTQDRPNLNGAAAAKGPSERLTGRAATRRAVPRRGAPSMRKGATRKDSAPAAPQRATEPPATTSAPQATATPQIKPGLSDVLDNLLPGARLGSTLRQTLGGGR